VNSENAITAQYDVDELNDLYPGLFHRPVKQQAKLALLWGLFLGFVIFCLWRTGFFNIARILEGTGKLYSVLQFMLPPAHNGWLGEFLYGILQTLGMAFIGTLTASIAAIPLGFLGAKNIVPNWIFHFGLRRFFDGLRGIDALIWALIFINMVGLGPFAGILAITVTDTGTLAKLFAEAIENIDRKQVEGVRSSGAGYIQVIRYGVLPQVLPVMLSNALYYFESNTRSATILGVVGAGGIGLLLSDRIRVNNWDEACFIIILILVTVSLIDLLSKNIRHRFIRSGG
jgi:phosphonate transport system permease protein